MFMLPELWKICRDYLELLVDREAHFWAYVQSQREWKCLSYQALMILVQALPVNAYQICFMNWVKNGCALEFPKIRKLGYELLLEAFLRGDKNFWEHILTLLVKDNKEVTEEWHGNLLRSQYKQKVVKEFRPSQNPEDWIKWTKFWIKWTNLPSLILTSSMPLQSISVELREQRLLLLDKMLSTETSWPLSEFSFISLLKDPNLPDLKPEDIWRRSLDLAPNLQIIRYIETKYTPSTEAIKDALGRAACTGKFPLFCHLMSRLPKEEGATIG